MFERFAQPPNWPPNIKCHLAIHVVPFVTTVAAIENHHSFCVCLRTACTHAFTPTNFWIAFLSLYCAVSKKKKVAQIRTSKKVAVSDARKVIMQLFFHR